MTWFETFKGRIVGAPTGNVDRSRYLPGGITQVLLVALAGGLIVISLSTNHQYLATTMIIYSLFAVSANMLLGWAGTPSFGQAAFFGGGSYMVAIWRSHDLNPLALIALAGVLGATMAFVFAIISMRSRGITFAMLTLVFGQVLYQLTFTVKDLGGDNGLPGIPSGSLFGQDLSSSSAFVLYALAIVTICLLLLRRVFGSTFGLTVVAIRDDPVRAAALGASVRMVRIATFTIAGFFSAIAGGLMAQSSGIVTPGNLYWILSGNVVVMCVIGGLYYFWGPVVGAVVFTYLSVSVFQGATYANMYVGGVLLAVVLVFKTGLCGLPLPAAKAARGLVARRRLGRPNADI